MAAMSWADLLTTVAAWGYNPRRSKDKAGTRARRAKRFGPLGDGIMLAILGLPSGSEWLVVLIVALLLFGKRLPSIMRTVARSLVGFRHEMQKARDEVVAEDPLEKREDAATSEPTPDENDTSPPSDEASGSDSSSVS